jgi:FkbM family methyltransferase
MTLTGAIIPRVIAPLSPTGRALLAARYEARRGERGLRVVEVLVGPGATAVDVGSNYGLYVAALSKRVGAGGRVHAIEPDPASLRALGHVVRRLGNVVLHPVAASDVRGEAMLRIPRASGRLVGSRASLEHGDPAAEQLVVPVCPLDDLVSDPVAFIKCDAEGHEHAVLRGARGILRRDRPVLLIEIEGRHTTDAGGTMATLDALDYEAFALMEDGLDHVDADEITRLQATPDSPSYVSDFVFCPRDRIEQLDLLMRPAPAGR